MKRVVTIVQQATVVIVVLFVVMLFANGRSGTGPVTSPAANGATAGERLYEAHCAMCHGVDGQGGVGPRLTGRVTRRFPDSEDQVTFVTNGRGGMPAFGVQLSAGQIRRIVEYTRDGL